MKTKAVTHLSDYLLWWRVVCRSRCNQSWTR